MKIGVISKGIPVYISDDAPNEHICITGMSGSGEDSYSFGFSWNGL